MPHRPLGYIHDCPMTFTVQKRQRPADNNAQGKPRSTVTAYAYHLTVLKVKILIFRQVPSRSDVNQSPHDRYDPISGKVILRIRHPPHSSASAFVSLRIRQPPHSGPCGQPQLKTSHSVRRQPPMFKNTQKHGGAGRNPIMIPFHRFSFRVAWQPYWAEMK